MGIKFNCPNGHKMHVKSFLAGKKGLCPRCGVRVEVPLQSVPENGTAAKAAAPVEASDPSSSQLSKSNRKAPKPAADPLFSLVLDDDAKTVESAPAKSDPQPSPSEGIKPKFADRPNDDGLSLASEADSPPSQRWAADPSEDNEDTLPLDEGLESDDEESDPGILPVRASPAVHDDEEFDFPSNSLPETQGASSPAKSVAAPLRNPLSDDPLGDILESAAIPSTQNVRRRQQSANEIRARLTMILVGITILLFVLLLFVLFRQHPGEKAAPKAAPTSRLPTRNSDLAPQSAC